MNQGFFESSKTVMRTDFKEKMGQEWEAIIKLGALEVQVQQFPVSWTWKGLNIKL